MTNQNIFLLQSQIMNLVQLDKSRAFLGLFENVTLHMRCVISILVAFFGFVMK